MREQARNIIVQPPFPTSAVPSSQSISKRAQIMQSRRKQKLINQLSNEIGPSNQAKIWQIVQKQIHAETYEKPYAQLFGDIKTKCQSQILMQNNEPKIQYAQNQNQPVYDNYQSYGNNKLQPSLSQHNLGYTATNYEAQRRSVTPANLFNANNYGNEVQNSYGNHHHQAQQFKRHYPIKAKQKIYNEWGAVLKHQDQILEEQKRIQLQRKYERQRLYGQQLKNQVNQRDENSRSNSKTAHFSDQKLIQNQLQMARQQQIRQQQHHQKLKELQKQRIQQSLIDKNNYMNLEKQRELEQKSRINQQFKKIQIEQNQRLRTNRYTKLQNAQQIRQALDNQSNYKKLQKLEQRNNNKFFANAQSKMLQDQEQKRQRFFDKLRYFQLKNDEKQKLYEQYRGSNLSQLSKADQDKYLSSLKQKLAQDQEHRQKLDRIQRQRLQQMGRSLEQQIKQKQSQHEADNVMNRNFAKKIENDIKQADIRDRAKFESQKQRQKQYCNELNNQIALKQEQRKLDGLMTEHQWKVNKSDMWAYKYAENHLYSMIPGMHNPNNQRPNQKYIDRLLGNNHESGISKRNNSDAVVAGGFRMAAMDRNAVRGSTGSSSQTLGRIGASILSQNTTNNNSRGQQQNISSSNALMNKIRNSFDPNTITGNPMQQQNLRQVKQNMKSIDALMQRNNTSNRIYGYNYVMGNKPFTSDVNIAATSQRQLAAGVPNTNNHYRGGSPNETNWNNNNNNNNNYMNKSSVVGGGSQTNRVELNQNYNINNHHNQNYESGRKGRGASEQAQRSYNIVTNRIF